MIVSHYRSGPMKLCVNGPQNFIDNLHSRFSLLPFHEHLNNPHTITVNLSVKVVAGDSLAIGSIAAHSRHSNSIVIHLGEYAQLDVETQFDHIFASSLIQVLFRYGFYYLHAACLLGTHSLVLITGPSETGKSTFGALLASQGLTLLSDDTIFLSLSEDRIELIPFPKNLAVRNSKRKPFSEYVKVDPFPISELPGKMQILLLFPRYYPGAVSLKKISVQDAIQKLEFVIPAENEDRFSLEQRSSFLAFSGRLLQTSRFQEILYCDSQLNHVAQDLRERLGV
jgi:hypothetical protein